MLKLRVSSVDLCFIKTTDSVSELSRVVLSCVNQILQLKILLMTSNCSGLQASPGSYLKVVVEGRGGLESPNLENRI
jgi:hypothetical protein